MELASVKAGAVQAAVGPIPRVPAPKGLGPSAAFWRQVTAEYDLRADELRLLADACREMDLVDRMQAEIDAPGHDLIGSGSQGQPVADPLVQEIRQHRAGLQRLLAGLKLEDPAAGAASRSASARKAANAKWQR